jgi:transposase-like protein
MVRPICPDCSMNMIVVDGFRLDFKGQSFECLRCGFTRTPTPNQTTKPHIREERLSQLS